MRHHLFLLCNTSFDRMLLRGDLPGAAGLHGFGRVADPPDSTMTHYQAVATQIDYPAAGLCDESLADTPAPRTIRDLAHVQFQRPDFARRDPHRALQIAGLAGSGRHGAAHARQLADELRHRGN